VLKPAEVLLLVRYRERFEGRVVEIGCGGGRILGYLVSLAGRLEAIDISPTMVRYCAAAFPEAHVRQGDLRALDVALEGAFDVVLASDNILDILDDGGRRRVLSEIRERHLGPGGLLVFSTHNLAHIGAPSAAPAAGSGLDSRESRHPARRALALVGRALDTAPAALVRGMGRRARELVNRRRLRRLEYRAGDHAVINDEAHEYGLLHYYIGRDDQQRQLEQLGYELVECLELDGAPVPAGRDGIGPSLYYVAAPAKFG
jgi:SAM-dependent methyltransferase